MLRELETYGCKITLDLRNQVLVADIPETKFVSPLSATIPRESFVSAAAMLMKAKQFDDGLSAAVEIACQNGCAGFEGKRILLEQFCRILANSSEDEVAAVIFAAAKLGGSVDSVPPHLELPRDEFLRKFEGDEKRSKPISFYTWNEKLGRIFRQDRALQTSLPGSTLAPLISALRNDPMLRRIYVSYVDLTAKLTNPLIQPSLTRLLIGNDEPRPNEPYAIFPASDSPERQLMMRLFGMSSPPPNFSLFDQIIAQLKDGRLSLKPKVDSGWYDYCLWALEPLAIPHTVPDSAKFTIKEKYAEQLLELFKGACALTRETHAKQLQGAYGSGPLFNICVMPDLKVEPLASVYYRRAIGYRFIRNALTHSLGEHALRQMHRLHAKGEALENLWDELISMENIFFGAYVVACSDLGMEPEPADQFDISLAVETFLSWRDAIGQDMDLSQDARMMVPIYYDEVLGKLKCWLFLGWTSKYMTVSFERDPEIVQLDLSACDHPMQKSPLHRNQTPGIQFVGQDYAASYPVSAEVYVDRLLNRNEFRSLCDRHKTADAILEAVRNSAMPWVQEQPS